MKNCLILLSFLLLRGVCYSQPVRKFEYIVNERPLEIDHATYMGMELEFNTQRSYLGKNEFKETRLFTGDNNQYIHYKITNGKWYTKSRNDWVLFYNFKSNKGGKLCVLDGDRKVLSHKKLFIRNYALHKIALESNKSYSSHTPYYYFEPNKGVVIIRTSTGINLVRKDCFKIPLTEEEQAYL